MSRPIRRRRQRRERLDMNEVLELTLGPSPKVLASGRLAFADDEDRLRAIERHADQLGGINPVWVHRYRLADELLFTQDPPPRRLDPFDAAELDELEISIDPPTTTNGTH